MSYNPDFTGPRVEIMLESGGNLVPLERILGLGPGVNFVERVNVKIGLGKILNMEITLDPPLDIALQILRKGIIGIGFGTVQKGTKSKTVGTNAETAQSMKDTTVVINKVSVRLWNGGISSSWFTGLLLQPDINIGPEGISITMQAFGFLFEASKTYPNKTFAKERTKKSVIQELLGNQVLLKTSKAADKILSGAIEKEITESRNNFEVAQDYLSRWNCGMRMEGSASPKNPGQVKIFALSEISSNPKVTAIFRAFMQIDPTHRIFPLTHFSSPISNLLLPSGPFGGVHGTSVGKSGGKATPTVNKVGAETMNERSPSKTSQPGKANLAGGMDASQTSNSGGMTDRPTQVKKPHPIPTDGEGFLDQMKGFVHDYIDRVFEFNIDSVGIPDILPGNRVGVSIAGIKEFTGDFDLYDVEHDWGSEGAKTNMHCVRTGGLASFIDHGIGAVVNKGADLAQAANKKISSSTGVSTQ